MNETPSLFEEVVQPGASWSHVLKRGTALRNADIEGGANVGALFYDFECPDMGRILCSITSDTVRWHDPLGGCSNAAMLRARYGEVTLRTEI